MEGRRGEEFMLLRGSGARIAAVSWAFAFRADMTEDTTVARVTGPCTLKLEAGAQREAGVSLYWSVIRVSASGRSRALC